MEVLDYVEKAVKVELPRFEEKRHEKFKRYKLGEDSFNLNVEAGDDEEEEVHDVRLPMYRDKAKKKVVASSIPLTSFQLRVTKRWLMVTGYASQTESFISMKKEDRVAFLEINKMEMEMQKKEAQNKATDVG
nr:hypothetical protein [Tanacetum cinerariifolium]